MFGFTWHIYGLPEDDPRRTYVEFTLEPVGAGTRLTVVETGFAQLPEDALPHGVRRQHRGLGERAGRAGRLPRCRLTSRRSPNRSSSPWPTRPGAPSWPRWPSGGPATATDLADRLPITRQAIAKHLALLAEAGLVTAEPGERRRVRYRLRSAPMQVAQQFLAALARDWDGPLDALKDHLDRDAGGAATTLLPETGAAS